MSRWNDAPLPPGLGDPAEARGFGARTGADGTRTASALEATDDLRLPRVPGVFRRFWDRHPRLADILIMVAFLLVEVPLLIAGAVTGQVPPLSWVVQVLACVAGASALLVRRRRPLLTIAVCTVASIAVLTAPGPSMGVIIFTVMVALHSVAVFRSTRDAWRSFGFVAVLLALAAWVDAAGDPVEWIGSVILTTLVLLLAVLIGANTGSKRRYVAALVDRTAQLARERDQQARLAAAAERNRIAGELHDIVAHGLTVMVRLADGADALAEQDPASARTAVRQIGSTGRASLAEMRRLMGVLRDDSGEAGRAPTGDGQFVGTTAQPDPAPALELAPQPNLAALPALADSYRSAGLPVVLETSGVLPSAEGVQLAVYRAVQEGLTNALRYSRSPSRVLARVVAVPGDGIIVEVVDDGEPVVPAASIGAGRGLIGMAERAALYGGTVASGALPGRGWRTRMTLPQARDDDHPAGPHGPGEADHAEGAR